MCQPRLVLQYNHDDGEIFLHASAVFRGRVGSLLFVQELNGVLMYGVIYGRFCFKRDGQPVDVDLWEDCDGVLFHHAKGRLLRGNLLNGHPVKYVFFVPLEE